MKDFSQLEQDIKVKFNNLDLLRQALVHRSYLNEHPSFELGNNERLEFLGDAVLEIIITEYLYQSFLDKPEGELTNWRASLVNAKMLYLVAKKLGAENFLYLSKGESKDKNLKSRQYILADVLEAIIGAIYLDQGIGAAKKFVLENIVVHLEEILANKLYLDPKSRFQELAQEKEGLTPMYKILKEDGPDHDKTFTVGLYLGQELISSGKGSSKQEAQIEAAEKGLKKRGWHKDEK
ncbi:MAG: ribonuclease III [Planctomycetes bacterium]|jgi:ribonuclease-3|nr:ribonuclease III [Planctomycetota bacterium]